MSASKKGAPCPCGSPNYATCCQPYHDGQPAPDAVSLMRSRYSAYVLGLMDYVWQTWDETTRPTPESLNDPDPPRWLGLSVKAHATQGDTATVEFVARYKIAGRAHRLHEVSRFRRVDGRWFYIDGQFPQTP